MSNNDSIDEETKRILTEVDADDSNESSKIKKDKSKKIQWETNEEDSPDSEW